MGKRRRRKTCYFDAALNRRGMKTRAFERRTGANGFRLRVEGRLEALATLTTVSTSSEVSVDDGRDFSTLENNDNA